MEKAFLRGNLICYISRTEGRRKLKFGEVGLQICENFLKKNRAKNFRPDCPFKANQRMATLGHQLNNKNGLLAPLI